MYKFNNIEEKIIFEKLTLNQGDLTDNKNTSDVNYFVEGQFNVAKLSSYISEISGYIDMLERTRTNHAYRPIISNRRYTGRLIVFVKKVIRKLLKFYVEPIAIQQSEFNNAVTPTIGRMTEIQNELINEIASLVDRIDKSNQIEKKVNREIEEIRKNIKNFEIEFTETKSNNERLQILLEDIKAYNDKLLKEFEEINIRCAESEKHIYSKLDENLKIQEIANIRIRNNEQKLNKLDELDLALFKEKEFNFWDKKTLSQSGEDSICAYINMVLGRPLEECTYLDLGANHAKDLSNTYLFYSYGARGVLVEANPALIPELKFYRNEDVVINKCVSTHSGEFVDFYVLSGDGLSTPSIDSAKECMIKNPEIRIASTIQVETICVNDILETYFAKAPVIMNIDVEGKDLEILGSIDFEKYRPLIIIAEVIEYKPTLVVSNKNKEIINLMEKNNYIEYAFTGINSIFIDKTQIEGVL